MDQLALAGRTPPRAQADTAGAALRKGPRNRTRRPNASAADRRVTRLIPRPRQGRRRYPVARLTTPRWRRCRRYPDDYRWQVVYAITLQHRPPRPTSPTPTNSSRCHPGEAVQQNPRIRRAHFIIHAYDFPPLADVGLRRPSVWWIAPAVPHRAICRRTSIRWWGCGRSRLVEYVRDGNPADYTMPPTSPCMPHLQLAQDAMAKREERRCDPPRGIGPGGFGNFVPRPDGDPYCSTGRLKGPPRCR